MWKHHVHDKLYNCLKQSSLATYPLDKRPSDRFVWERRSEQRVPGTDRAVSWAIFCARGFSTNRG